ncbi:MAG TPA: monovalent cation/H+ antiporter complex subunit F [bacterium]|nr:monovalent cation/H+ antiporter complex subunit F [bacterium]
MNVVLIIFLACIGVGIILCFLRMVGGPTSADRMVGVDTFATVTVALLVLMGFILERRVYLDVSLVYAVLTFVGTVAVARYFERGI